MRSIRSNEVNDELLRDDVSGGASSDTDPHSDNAHKDLLYGVSHPRRLNQTNQTRRSHIRQQGGNMLDTSKVPIYGG